jgi:L-amino acid N-acyltransferase YncA
MAAIIRLATPEDAARIQAIYAPYCESTVISFEEEPPTVEEIRSRMDQAGERYPWLVAEEDGVVTGYAYAAPHRARAAYRWSCDVSIYLEHGARGKGTGRALYMELLPLLARQGFVNAHAGIALPNAASVALHESSGFTQVALYPHVGWKLGQWWDVGWWQLALASPSTETPPETLLISEAWVGGSV